TGGRRARRPAPGRSCAPSPTGPAAQLATRCAAGLPPLPTRDTTGRLRMAKGNVAQARTAGGNVTTAEPEFVQLLTPEGDRVEHPSYTVDFNDEEYRTIYRDFVIVRRLHTI